MLKLKGNCGRETSVIISVSNMTVTVTTFSEMFYPLTLLSFFACRWFLKGYSNPVDFSYKNESQSIREVGKKLQLNINVRITPNLLYAFARTDSKMFNNFSSIVLEWGNSF